MPRGAQLTSRYSGCVNIPYHYSKVSSGNIQGVQGEKVNILGGHSIGHSKQKCLYEHVSYYERFPR